MSFIVFIVLFIYLFLMTRVLIFSVAEFAIVFQNGLHSIGLVHETHSYFNHKGLLFWLLHLKQYSSWDLVLPLLWDRNPDSFWCSFINYPFMCWFLSGLHLLIDPVPLWEALQPCRNLGDERKTHSKLELQGWVILFLKYYF